MTLKTRPEPTATAGWDIVHTPRSNAALKLFCFAYAGGTAAVFRDWSETLGANVELHAVQLPGRANRFNEAPRETLPQLIDDLLPGLTAVDRPFALFGHSMGALLAFELARALRRHHRPLPSALFVSGCRGPHLPDRSEHRHNMSDHDFITALHKLGGTPGELLENTELLRLLLPTLRADFQVCETYRFTPEEPLAIPITAFGGLADPEATLAELQGWREHSRGTFVMHAIPGDHFFLHTHEELVWRHLGSALARL